MLVTQYNSELDSLQILVADVLDGGNDPQFVHGRDFIGRSRERNLETDGGTNNGLGVSTSWQGTEVLVKVYCKHKVACIFRTKKPGPMQVTTV